MKKIISVIFVSFVFAVILFSANAYAAETERAPDVLSDILDSEELQLSLLYKDGETNTKIVYYIKGEKIAIDAYMPVADISYNVLMRCVIYGDHCYIYLPKFPFFYIKVSADVIDESMDTSMINYIGTEEKIIDGKEYTVEKYEYEGETVGYGRINDEIVFIETYTDYYNIVYIESISYSVNDLVFVRPFWAIDLSGFFSY